MEGEWMGLSWWVSVMSLSDERMDALEESLSCRFQHLTS